MAEDLETEILKPKIWNGSFILMFNPQVHSYQDVLSEVIDPYLMDVENVSGEEGLRNHYDHQLTPDLGIFRVSRKVEDENEFFEFFIREEAVLQEISESVYYLEKLPHEDSMDVSPEEFRTRFRYALNFIKHKESTKNLLEFDADFSINHDQNIRAAEARGLRYNPDSGCYEDSDGCLIKDEFGQDL